MQPSASFFDTLAKYGIVIEEKYRLSIESKLDSIRSYQPRVGIFGKTGAGKSSLCNAVFGKDVCAISDVSACTRSPQEVILSIRSPGIILLDVPGIGESVERDKEYNSLYKSLLPELDVILWVIKGDDRAFSTDESFYKRLVRPYIDANRPFFIVLNQVDKIEPYRDWDEATRRPGSRQSHNIEEKRRSISAIFDIPLTQVIPVSANERYGLIDLVDHIIHALPKDKKGIFLDEVDDDTQSTTAKDEANEGFWDVVVDIVKEIIPAVVPLIQSITSFFRWW